MSKKVFLGMSGGVDSSVSAVLLCEQGYEVTGVYMKNWSEDLPGMKCPWAEDLADAKRVAVRLGINFEVWDFEQAYREKVVDYMLAEFQRGRTPNPDIMCNQEIKFKLFYERAMEQGADYIATGHYARTTAAENQRLWRQSQDRAYNFGSATEQQISLMERKYQQSDHLYHLNNLQSQDYTGAMSGVSQEQAYLSSMFGDRVANEISQNQTSGDSVWGDRNSGSAQQVSTASGAGNDGRLSPDSSAADLARAVDDNKDQTYFLYRMHDDATARTLFPVGGLYKPEVKELAARFGLDVAYKKESMGVCFVGEVGMKEFLRNYLDAKSGEIREQETGKVLGYHDGAIFYTLGQRHGLYVGGGLPYYVVGKDLDQNIIYVSRNLNHSALWTTKLHLTDLHLRGNRTSADIEAISISSPTPKSSKVSKVNIASAQKPQTVQPASSSIHSVGSQPVLTNRLSLKASSGLVPQEQLDPESKIQELEHGVKNRTAVDFPDPRNQGQSRQDNHRQSQDDHQNPQDDLRRINDRPKNATHNLHTKIIVQNSPKHKQNKKQEGSLTVRLRHRGPLIPARLEGDSLIFGEPIKRPAAGQSAVFYDGDICLGGGIIAEG